VHSGEHSIAQYVELALNAPLVESWVVEKLVMARWIINFFFIQEYGSNKVRIKVIKIWLNILPTC